MASENPHHSSLHGADSMSYSENGLGSRSNPSGLHTYEQRVEASGLGGERYRAGPQAEHPTQTAAHESLAAPGADGSRRTNPDGTYRSHGRTAEKEGTVSGNPEAKRPTGMRRTTSASSASSSASSNDGGRAAAGGLGSAGGAQDKGDSKAGKLMEKVGRSIHSAKLAEKGEAKREKAAGMP